MITEHDLQEAIAECQGVKNPNASTCIKLAAFLTIQKEMYGDKTATTPPALESAYSFDAGPTDTVEYYSDTEFGQAIEGRKADNVWDVMDELMSTLKILHPRLYAAVLRKIRD